MALELPFGIALTNPKANIDEYYGPYASVEAACSAVPSAIRAVGKTVGILDATTNKITEYWWQEGVADINLVKKTAEEEKYDGPQYIKGTCIRKQDGNFPANITLKINNSDKSVSVDSNGKWKWEKPDDTTITSLYHLLYFNSTNRQNANNFYVDTIEFSSNFDISNLSDLNEVFSPNPASNIVVPWLYGHKNSNPNYTSFLTDSHIVSITGLKYWDISHITSAQKTFCNLTELVNLDIEDWDVSNLTNCLAMFWNTFQLSLNINAWHFDSLDVPRAMFQNSHIVDDKFNFCIFANTKCTGESSSLFRGTRASFIDFSGFNTSQCSSTSRILADNYQLKTIILNGNFILPSNKKTGNQFQYCENLSKIVLSSDGTTPSISNQIDLHYSPIDLDSANIILDALQDVSGLTPSGDFNPVVLFSKPTWELIQNDATTLAKLQVAETKGWSFTVPAQDDANNIFLQVNTNGKPIVCYNQKQTEFVTSNDIKTPDWNASEGEDGYIDNRTHYSKSQHATSIPFDATSGSVFDYDNGIELNVGDTLTVIAPNGVTDTAIAVADGQSQGWIVIHFTNINAHYRYTPGSSSGYNGEWNGDTSYLPQTLYKESLKQLDSKYVKVDNDTIVVNSNDKITVSNNIARTSQIPVVSQQYDGTSMNAQSGIAVAEALAPIEEVIPSNASSSNKLVDKNTLDAALSPIEEVIPSAASSSNKLVDFNLLVDSIQQQVTEYIASDISMVVPFEHCTNIGDQNSNLENGPWYKDGVECGTGSPAVYVTENDYAVVLNDESVCYFEAYGYRYQRHKDGGASTYGYVVLPDTNHTQVLIQAGIYDQQPVLYFVDNSHIFSENDIVYVVNSLVILQGAVLELTSLSDVTPIHTYDLLFPTTRYVCTQSQTDVDPPVWSFAYAVNDSPLTGAQMQVLNSGATAELINQITINTNAISNLATVATTGSYNDLIDKPEKVSEFENDANYIVGRVIKDELDEQWKGTYRQVYYIESTKSGSTYGQQYIDLGFKPTRSTTGENPFDNTGFYIDFMPFENTVNSNSRFFFSSGAPKITSSDPGDRLHFNNYKSGTGTYNGEMKLGAFTPTNITISPVPPQDAQFDPAISANRRLQIEYKQGKLKNYFTGQETADFTSELNDFESRENLLLFCANGSNAVYGGTKSQFAYYRLFQFKIYNNITGDTLMNLLPVIRISDNKPGLIDNLTGTFYINQGSGDDFNYNPTGDGVTFSLSNIYKDVNYALKSDIGNGKLTIQKNGTDIDVFYANSTGNKTINITVPTSVSDLTDGANYVQTIDFTANSSEWDYIMGNSNN